MGFIRVVNESSSGGGTASDTSYDNSLSGLSATDVQDAIDELAGGVSVAKYSQTFNNTTDWGAPSGGYYSIQVLATTHSLGTNPNVQVFESAGGGSYDVTTPDMIRINSSGDVTIVVTENIDARFTGKLIIF